MRDDSNDVVVLRVVSGVEATNIGMIGTFLKGRVDQGMYRQLRPHTDARQFERAITNLRPDPKGEHIFISFRWQRRGLAAG